MENRATYDNPMRRAYTFASQNLATGQSPTAKTIVPPNGRGGRVISVTISDPTVAFVTGATTAAKYQVGDGTTVNKYFDSGDVVQAVNTAKDYVNSLAKSISQDIERGRSTITVTPVAATGSSGTGTAIFTVLIEWF